MFLLVFGGMFRGRHFACMSERWGETIPGSVDETVILLKQCDLFQANIKLEAYGYAIADATRAVELDPSYIKVHTPQIIIPSDPALLEEILVLFTDGATLLGLLETCDSQHSDPSPERSPQGFQDSRAQSPE